MEHGESIACQSLRRLNSGQTCFHESPSRKQPLLEILGKAPADLSSTAVERSKVCHANAIEDYPTFVQNNARAFLSAYLNQIPGDDQERSAIL
jgi:hypothetical protein